MIKDSFQADIDTVIDVLHGNKVITKKVMRGGLVSSFQDEWFKRTWITMDFDIADRRAYWNNQQTNEQHFGLLAFESGKSRSSCYVDGKKKDWVNEVPLSTNGKQEVYVKCDDAYVYFMVNNYRLDTDEPLLIPIDTIPDQGNLSFGKALFEHDADFVISIDGPSNSRILVDSYYDSFHYLYGEKLGMIPISKNFYKKNSGEFVPMYLCLNKSLILPEDKITIPFQKYKTGGLHYGNANPNSKEYNSLADFSAKQDTLEIRIPWQLLNIMDPSTLSAMDDFHQNGIKPRSIQGIYVGVGLADNNTIDDKIKMNLYSWSTWNMPVYHERLKPSYYIMKEAFAKYN